MEIIPEDSIPEDIFQNIYEEISYLIKNGKAITYKEELNIKKKIEVYWEVFTEKHQNQLRYELLPALHDKVDPDAYEEFISMYELLVFKELITPAEYEDLKDLVQKGWDHFTEDQQQEISDLLPPLLNKIITG